MQFIISAVLVSYVTVTVCFQFSKGIRLRKKRPRRQVSVCKAFQGSYVIFNNQLQSILAFHRILRQLGGRGSTPYSGQYNRYSRSSI